MPNVTIRTIAKDLGLTTPAVSVALNGSPKGTTKVSSETAERVRAYAAKMNYRPSLAWRAARTKSLRQVGVLVEANFGKRRHAPVVEMPAIFGLGDLLESRDWHMNLVDDAGERSAGVRMPRYLREKALDGVVVLSTSQERDRRIEHDLRRYAIPAVFLNSERRWNGVSLDDRFGAALATRHLAGLGHRKIAFVGPASTHVSLARRVEGYRDVMGEAGLKPAIHFFREQSDEEKADVELRVAGHHAEGRRLIEEFCRKHRPTALVCYDDGLALIVMRMLHKAGISVPGDISVVGYNDLPHMDMLPVALTTVRSDFYAMARCAGDLLLKLIEKPTARTASIVFKPELVVRESTAGPA